MVFTTSLGALFDELNLSSYFTKLRYSQLRDVTIARIADPSSKLRTSQILTDQFLKPFSENQIYRLMDDLIEQEDSIKKLYLKRQRN